jgi:hypothetical protein
MQGRSAPSIVIIAPLFMRASTCALLNMAMSKILAWIKLPARASAREHTVRVAQYECRCERARSAQIKRVISSDRDAAPATDEPEHAAA